MPYATQDDMLARYGAEELRRLSDIGTPRVGAIVPDVIDRALTDASAWLDGYLVGRYVRPITDSAALAKLNFDCAAEARFLLMTVNVDPAAQAAHDERVKYYTAVAMGTINLIAPAQAPAPDGVGSVLFEPGTNVFRRDCGDVGGRSCW